MADCCNDKECAIEALRNRQAGTLRIVLAILLLRSAARVMREAMRALAHADKPAAAG